MLARLVMVTAMASLVLLFGMPQSALACHQGVPHGNETSCDGAGAPGAGVFQFVGFTDDATNALADTIDGGQGFLAMHELCQDDFGPDARMCTGEEFWLSPNAEAPLALAAWLHSASVFLVGAMSANCVSWSTTSSSATVILSTGQFKGRGCILNFPVTCCGPAQ